MSEIDSFIDMSEDDLLRIYELATRHAHLRVPENAPEMSRRALQAY